MNALRLAREVAARFAEAGIRYCHFKSNIRLEDAVTGRTDLDLLFHPEDRALVQSEFGALDIKRVESRWNGSYPGLEDFLGFDSESGQLLHFHVHYRLIIGRKYSKCFELACAPGYLERAPVVDGVRPAAAEDELILLALRAHTKLGIRAVLSSFRGGGGMRLYPRDIQKEFGWLLGRCKIHDVATLLPAFGLGLSPPDLTSFLEAVAAGSLTAGEVRRFRGKVFAALRSSRWMGREEMLRRSIAGRFYRNKWVKRATTHRKKRLPTGGLVVALVGADGSGKSTLARDIGKWLAWKLSTREAYLGLPRQAPKVRLLRKLERIGFSALQPRLLGLRWLTVARERSKVARLARRFAARGEVVIADRYPMREFWAMPEPMDGPRCRGGEASGFADREEAVYSEMERPDLVVMLKAPIEVLRGRETGPPLEIHERKASAVNALEPGPTRIAVDASRPYPEVLLDVQRGIWAAL